MKFLNKKVNDCVQHIIILHKFTNFHAIRSWNFQNICNELGWPRFFSPPCMSFICLGLYLFCICVCRRRCISGGTRAGRSRRTLQRLRVLRRSSSRPQCLELRSFVVRDSAAGVVVWLPRQRDGLARPAGWCQWTRTATQHVVLCW